MTLDAAEKAGVPVVRGLVWKFNSTNSVWSGELPFNTYYTITGEGPKWRVFRGQFLSSADEEEIAYVADQNEAKAAAQADWEKLSREIINPDFLSELDTARAEIERLRRENAGLRGGEATYVAALTAAQERIAELENLVQQADAIFTHCTVSDGVCGCGDSMENHSDPMLCGHSPADHGAYIADLWREAARATLSPAVKEPK